MNGVKYFYYIYQIINKINGKIYVGVHKTTNINDNYWGSGTALKKAIKEYGKDNFEKTILQFFDSLEEMFAMEIEIVNKSFIMRDDTYNLSLGGYGGSIVPSAETRAKRSLSMKGRKQSAEHIRKRAEANKGKKHSEEARKRMSEAHRGITLSDECKKRLSEIHKRNRDRPPSFLGKKHSEESKRKISDAKTNYWNRVKLLHDFQPKLAL